MKALYSDFNHFLKEHVATGENKKILVYDIKDKRIIHLRNLEKYFSNNKK